MLHYTHTVGSMIPVHRELLDAGLRGLVLSGQWLGQYYPRFVQSQVAAASGCSHCESASFIIAAAGMWQLYSSRPVRTLLQLLVI